jgi:hypothetical protein
VAAALAAAHAAGIVHRDITPGNILIATDGVARLTDFGIAHGSGDASAVTATGLLMGTMRYLAPEQLRGGTSTPASDLHGLAAVAYEMLAGHPAYDASSPVALAEAQQAGPRPIEGVARDLDAAVRRGLAVDPADRPPDVGAFAASIEAALTDQQTVAIPIVGAESQAGIRPAGRPRFPRRLPAPVAIVLGLLVAAGALVAATGSDRPAGAGPAAAGSSAAPTLTPNATLRPAATPAPKAEAGKGAGEKKDKGKGDGKGKGG